MLEGVVSPGETLAIVGASARSAAFSSLRAGMRVVAADLFADADLASRCPATRVAPYPEGFESWLRHTSCARWMYTGALENNPGLVDRLAAIRPLAGNAGDSLRRVRDPMAMQSVLRSKGLRFPETTRVRQKLGPKWLAKTYRGSCGSGVSAKSSEPFPRECYYQQRIDGMPMSAVYRDGALMGITRQLVGEAWAGAASFQYCGTIAPWPVSVAVQSELEKLGSVLREEFRLSGLFGVDAILSEGQAWMLEVNPRYTAAVEVVERARHDPTRCFGKAILFAKQPAMVDAALSESLLHEADDIDWPRLADIPGAGTQIDCGEPILTCFSESSTPAEVFEMLRCQSAMLESRWGRS